MFGELLEVLSNLSVWEWILLVFAVTTLIPAAFGFIMLALGLGGAGIFAVFEKLFKKKN